MIHGSTRVVLVATIDLHGTVTNDDYAGSQTLDRVYQNTARTARFVIVEYERAYLCVDILSLGLDVDSTHVETSFRIIGIFPDPDAAIVATLLLA